MLLLVSEPLVCIFKRKPKALLCQEGSPAVGTIQKLCLTFQTIFNGVAVFFSFYLFIYFHSEMEEEKALLLINEDFILLLHVTSFALLRFCIGSQELRSIIKSTPA